MMQIYLVGGAVRDTLLGRPVLERDYVVVGSTPETMLAQGFRPVGSDFPVFLHPTTQDEYALARTERKSGVGYAGFTFHTSAKVTLEEDLIRRDLTINAIAQDAHGNIFDPYNGQQDLHHKVLRHVSPAFAEDPLRVLRVARFAARYAPLGFTIAAETMALMQQLSQSGELIHLKAERIWKETERALQEDQAEVYFQVLRDCGALKILFAEIDALFGVPQSPQHHPEIDCGIHALLALQVACKAQFNTAVRFAALIHDLGKALTPAEILPKHIEHERRGIEPVTALCERLKVPSQYKDLAIMVCRDHLIMHQVMHLKPASLWRLFRRLDVLRRPERFIEFIQACQCDARGRLGLEQKPYPQADFVIRCAETVRQVKAKDLPAEVTGLAIGYALEQKRIAAIAQFYKHNKSSDDA